MTTSKPLVITATMLRWFHQCDRHVWLDLYGNRAEREELSSMTVYRLNEGVRHEEAVHHATAPQAHHVVVRNWADGVQKTLDFMEHGVRTIIGAYLEHSIRLEGIETPVVLRGKVDRLDCHRSNADSSDKRWIYIPKEIKRYSRITAEDELQLDFYIWMLSLIQHITLSQAEFWLNGRLPGQLVKRVAYIFNKPRFLVTLTQTAQTLLPTAPEPPVVLKHACGACCWQSSCYAIAEANHDVTLLPALHPNTRHHFKERGITRLDQIAMMSPEDLRQFKGIQATAEGIRAHAEAFLSKAPVWYRQLPDWVVQGGWMLDIETIMPDNKAVWCLGWRGIEKGETVVVNPGYAPCWIPLADNSLVIGVPDADETWRVFANAVNDGRPIFHWGTFDNTVMEKYAPEDVQHCLTGRMHDLHHIFDRSVKCPLSSTKIKVVVPYLIPSFTWTQHTNPDAAYLDYRMWYRNGDLEALTRACGYSRNDVDALLLVWQWMVDNHPNE